MRRAAIRWPRVADVRAICRRAIAGLSAAILYGPAVPAMAAGPHLTLWAWERPEDLRFVGNGAGVAPQVGFVVLTGEAVFVRHRRFPLLTVGTPAIAMVHVEIDHHLPFAWTAAQRAQAAAAVRAVALTPGVTEVQVDFEVRRSERQALLDLLADLRRGLPAGVRLSMTALASWCETESWIDAAPVDEIVPMLFRMGRGGEGLKARLANGGDFADPRCRTAFAVSSDAPLARAPAGRRVYVFDPHSWTAADYARVRQEIAAWPLGGH